MTDLQLHLPENKENKVVKKLVTLSQMQISYTNTVLL